MTTTARRLARLIPRAGCLLAATVAASPPQGGPERDPARLIDDGRCRQAASLLEAMPAAATAGTEARLLLGRAYLGMGRYDEAAAIVGQPGPPGSEATRLEAVAQVFEARGDLDRALAALTEAVEERRRALPSAESLDGAAGMADSRTRLGGLAFRAGRLDLAKDQFQKAIAGLGEAHAKLHAQDVPHDERDPRLAAAGATAGLAQVYGAQGDAARAERSWRGVMARTDDPAILAGLVSFYAARDDARAAQRHRERALKLTEGKPALRRIRALLLADRAETLDEALALAEAVYGDGPDVRARDTLAWVLHRRGDDPRAAQVIRPALDLGTKDPTLLCHAGLIAQARGEAAEARRLLASCLALNPAFDPLAAREATRQLRNLR